MLSKATIRRLEAAYKKNPNASKEEQKTLATKLKLTITQVKAWFYRKQSQNTRSLMKPCKVSQLDKPTAQRQTRSTKNAGSNVKKTQPKEASLVSSSTSPAHRQNNIDANNHHKLVELENKFEAVSEKMLTAFTNHTKEVKLGMESLARVLVDIKSQFHNAIVDIRREMYQPNAQWESFSQQQQQQQNWNNYSMPHTQVGSNVPVGYHTYEPPLAIQYPFANNPTSTSESTHSIQEL